MTRRLLTFNILFSLVMLFSPTATKAQNDHYFEVSKHLQIFNDLYKHLNLLYVDSITPSENISTAINAMLARLDPYTEYYSDDKASELKEMLTGKFAGIGSVIRYNQQLKNVVIEEPSEGMPAAEAGLRKGDIIVSINDSSMAGKTVQYVTKRLRGEAGTTRQTDAHPAEHQCGARSREGRADTEGHHRPPGGRLLCGSHGILLTRGRSRGAHPCRRASADDRRVLRRADYRLGRI